MIYMLVHIHDTVRLLGVFRSILCVDTCVPKDHYLATMAKQSVWTIIAVLALIICLSWNVHVMQKSCINGNIGAMEDRQSPVDRLS